MKKIITFNLIVPSIQSFAEPEMICFNNNCYVLPLLTCCTSMVLPNVPCFNLCCCNTQKDIYQGTRTHLFADEIRRQLDLTEAGFIVTVQQFLAPVQQAVSGSNVVRILLQFYKTFFCDREFGVHILFWLKINIVSRFRKKSG